MAPSEYDGIDIRLAIRLGGFTEDYMYELHVAAVEATVPPNPTVPAKNVGSDSDKQTTNPA